MSVTLRWKKYPNGTLSAYLDIYEQGNRRKKYIDVKIPKNSTQKKELKKKASAIATKVKNSILDQTYGIISEDKQKYCFLKYFQNQIDKYEGLPSTKKKRWALVKFIDFLKSDKRIKVQLVKTRIKSNTRVGTMEIEKVNCDSSTNTLPFKSLSKSITLFEDYKSWLCNESKSGLTGETPYDYWAKLRWALNRAVKENYLIKSPLQNITFQKPKPVLTKEILTKEEIQTLVNTPCGNDTVKAAFIFACFTGMGAKEIRNLTWDHIKNGRIKTRREKNGNLVWNKLPDVALKILDGVPKRSSEYIFNNLPTTTNGVNKVLKNWVTRAGIEKHCTFYVGRHSFAVMSLKSSKSEKITANLLGHSTTAHTKKYLTHVEELEDKAMDNMPFIEI